MIICYACNQWKPGDISPFAICEDCKRPEAVDRDLARRLQLARYWQLDTVKQNAIFLIAAVSDDDDVEVRV